MRLFFEHRECELDLALRVNLFPKYRFCYPDKEVKITMASGQTKRVLIKDLKTEAEERNEGE